MYSLNVTRTKHVVTFSLTLENGETLDKVKANYKWSIHNNVAVASFCKGLNFKPIAFSSNNAEIYDPVKKQLDDYLGNYDKLREGTPNDAHYLNPNYKEVNRNNRINSKAGAILAGFEFALSIINKNTPGYKSDMASQDMLNQISAYRTALSVVNSYDKLLSKAKVDNLDVLKVHLAGYLVDGRLPGTSKEYDNYISGIGDEMRKLNPNVLNTKVKQNVE